MDDALPNNDSDFLSTQDVASILAVSPQAVRSWVREGKLRSYKAGRQNRITVGDLKAFLTGRGFEESDLVLRLPAERPRARARREIKSREYSREEIDGMVEKDRLPDDLRWELDRILGK